MFLDDILAAKRDEVEYLRLRRSLKELRAQARDAPPARDFYEVVKRGKDGGSRLAGRCPPGAGTVNLIAEIKKASPSRGLIRRDFDAAAIARACEQGGARALSVLTEAAFFQGDPGHLAIARSAATLPLLRKDFIISDYQVYESRLLGADAVLLIVAVLAPSQLEDYLGLAAELGLSALIEAHTEAETMLAVSHLAIPGSESDGSRDGSLWVPAAPASGGETGHSPEAPHPGAGAAQHVNAGRLVGINNRDLQTFQTDLDTTFKLLPLIPPGTVVVSESGIRAHEQVLRLGAAGVDAVLVGEALMEQEDIAAAVRGLLGGET
jgi:indole-3-glycerol phosphate synthase